VVSLFPVRNGRVGLSDPGHCAVEVLEEQSVQRRRSRSVVLDHRVDHRVRDSLYEARLPVVQVALCEAVVEEGVHDRVRHRSDLRQQRFAESAQRGDVLLRSLDRACVTHDDRGELQRGIVGRVHEPAEHRQLVRDLGLREVAIEAKDVLGGFERVRDEASDDHAQGMEPVLERCCDAEVSSPSTQRPEEVGIGLLGDAPYFPVCRHQLDREQVVCGEPRGCPSANRDLLRA